MLRSAEVYFMEVYRPRPTINWTTSEARALQRLADRMDVDLMLGTADDGAPWAALGESFSLVREEGPVVVLNADGQAIAEGPNLEWAISAFETTWWSRSKTA